MAELVPALSAFVGGGQLRMSALRGVRWSCELCRVCAVGASAGPSHRHVEHSSSWGCCPCVGLLWVGLWKMCAGECRVHASEPRCSFVAMHTRGQVWKCHATGHVVQVTLLVDQPLVNLTPLATSIPSSPTPAEAAMSPSSTQSREGSSPSSNLFAPTTVTEARHPAMLCVRLRSCSQQNVIAFALLFPTKFTKVPPACLPMGSASGQGIVVGITGFPTRACTNPDLTSLNSETAAFHGRAQLARFSRAGMVPWCLDTCV